MKRAIVGFVMGVTLHFLLLLFSFSFFLSYLSGQVLRLYGSATPTDVGWDWAFNYLCPSDFCSRQQSGERID